MFVEIPGALGLRSFDETTALDDAGFHDFFARLNSCLQELADALPTVVVRARNQLLKECEFSESNAGWLQLVEIAEEVRHFCNSPRLLPLLQRLVDSGSTDGGESEVRSRSSPIARPPPGQITISIDSRSKRVTTVQMFRQLAGGRKATPSYRAVLETLTGDERQQSEKLVRRLAEKLNGFRAKARNPRILEAAFLMLAEKARSERNPEVTHDRPAHKR